MISKFRRRLLIDAARKNNKITYPGLIAAWSAKGKSNDDADRNVLRDLTGNGHDITLNGFAFNTEGSGYNNPEYPDALVFDGVDDYGIINKDNPVLEDFTIIAKRIYQNDKKNGCLLSKYKIGNSCFSFESNGNNFGVFGSPNVIIYSEIEIVYGTTKSYNGERSLTKGNNRDANFVQIKLGTFDDVRFSNFAFYSTYLFDRSLDEQEIKAFIRKYIDADYLLPSEQTTE